MVGTGLLLGPLMFALTLPRMTQAPAVCEAVAAPLTEAVVVEVEVCEPEQAPVPEPAPTQTPPIDGLSTFLFVSPNGLVLSEAAAPAWGTGKFYEPPGDATYRVAKRPNLATLPAALLTQRGRSFDLYGKQGKVCSARVGGLHVIRQYAGSGLDGVMGDAWQTYGESSNVPKRAWRNALWRGDGPADLGTWLVADIESDESCEGALWARDAALPAPLILTPTSDQTPEATARIAQYKRSKGFAQARAEYRDWYAGLSPDELEYQETWAQMAERRPVTVTSWRDADAQVRVVELWGVGARRAALHLVDGDSFEDTKRPAFVTAIVDADLDGELEYLYSNTGDWWSMTLNSQTDTLDLGVSIDRDAEGGC